ncbi:helix-turn-helix domain-containing protein [Desertimonas flava]|uniref:helix-turn-helix domain-containing protein n=1 Tax=Desertimonas flava TaxID=2064846 RepID=UPI000E3562EE|nr:helix-turn-helix transcriptional regulator [Desertimonas flava]
MTTELGERLRRERLRRKERQIDTAERFGIHQASYARWETGHNRPDDDRFAVIADYLGLEIEEVWSLVHKDAPEPTSLDGLNRRVDEMARDIADLRSLIGELRSVITSTATMPPLTESKPAPTGRRRRG